MLQEHPGLTKCLINIKLYSEILFQGKSYLSKGQFEYLLCTVNYFSTIRTHPTRTQARYLRVFMNNHILPPVAINFIKSDIFLVV